MNKDYILKTGNILSKGVDEGWGSSPSYNPADVVTKAKLKQSAYIFSSAKNVAFQQELANNLRDADGKLRSFHDFKNIALAKDATYNKTYLQAEYQTAVASSAAAKKWAGFERRAERYPNLEYKTVGDGHVRDAHRALHGIIRPITHAFWNSYYPPNGWRCRCYVVQTDRNPNGDFSPEPDEKTVPKYFRLNSGKTGEALPKGHPYFKAIEGQVKPSVPDGVRKAIPYEKVLELENGSELHVHPFHDFDDNAHSRTQKQLNVRDGGEMVKEFPKTILKLPPILLEGKNPDFIANDLVGDRVKPETASLSRKVTNAFRQKYADDDDQLAHFDMSFLMIDLGKKITGSEKKVATRLALRMALEPKNEYTILRWDGAMVKVVNKTGLTEDDVLNALNDK